MKSLRQPKQKTELLERLRLVEPDSPRQWGKMSPHQMICHLTDTFRMSLGEKEIRPVGGLLHHTAMKWYALRAPIAWPKGLKTLPEIDQAKGGTKPIEFEQDARGLATILERFVAEQSIVVTQQHAIFGQLSESEWLRWGYLHMDHHLRQFGA